MDYVLTTQGLSKHYKGFKALDALTMHVPKGSIYGFVGPNFRGIHTLWYRQPREIYRQIPPPYGCGGRDSIHLSGYDGGGQSEGAVSGTGSAFL